MKTVLERPLAWVVRPAEGVDPIGFLEAHPDEPAAAFLPPSGPAIVAVGQAAVVRASGPDRFERVAEAGRALLASLGAAGPVAPRLVGGFAFACGSAAAAPWSEFGDAAFVLPRAAWIREGGRSWLCSTGPVSAGTRVPSIPAPVASVRRVAHLPVGRWRRGVESIHDGIAAGRFEKVVLARRAEVELDRAGDAAGALGRIRRGHPRSTAFLFRPGRATFLGAAPERLIERRGDAVRTEALAGTAEATPGGAERLAASAKDRREHAPVVRHLLERLGPFCRRLETAAEPNLRRVGRLVHLATLVGGELARPAHVLDLVRALHPTPAVGGSPVDPALDWIDAGEAEPRGWYAGPFGWFDGAGDGEFAVALRSGVVDGSKAWAWAGAGIVAGSDAASEYAETGSKMRPFLEALAGEGAVR